MLAPLTHMEELPILNREGIPLTPDTHPNRTLGTHSNSLAIRPSPTLGTNPMHRTTDSPLTHLELYPLLKDTLGTPNSSLDTLSSSIHLKDERDWVKMVKYVMVPAND